MPFFDFETPLTPQDNKSSTKVLPAAIDALPTIPETMKSDALTNEWPKSLINLTLTKD
jgi:hypothetical protein